MIDLDVISIVKRVRDGDEDAFVLIVQAYQAVVWRLVVGLLHDRATTEDVVQRVFIDIYLKIDRLEQASDPGAWIRTCALNMARNEIRSRKRKKSLLSRYHEWLLTAMTNEKSFLEQRETRHQQLARCQEHLSVENARVMGMRYEESMSFEEIGRHVGKSATAVEKLISRIRISLRDCMGREMASV